MLLDEKLLDVHLSQVSNGVSFSELLLISTEVFCDISQEGLTSCEISLSFRNSSPSFTDLSVSSDCTFIRSLLQLLWVEYKVLSKSKENVKQFLMVESEEGMMRGTAWYASLESPLITQISPLRRRIAVGVTALV